MEKKTELEELGKGRWSSTVARAVGQKNEAVAQVQLIRGNGIFLINGEHARAYLQNDLNSLISIKDPFEVLLSSEVISPFVRVGWAKGGFVIIKKRKKRKKKSVPLGEPVVASLPVNPTEERTAFQTDPSIILIIDDCTLIIKDGSLNISVTTSLINNGSLIRRTNSLIIAPSEIPAEGKENDENRCPMLTLLNFFVTVEGGDLKDQVNAIKLGLARALWIYENEEFGKDGLRPIFERKGYILEG